MTTNKHRIHDGAAALALLLALGTPMLAADAGCGGGATLPQPGRTALAARETAAESAGVSLCEEVAAANLSFEAPVLGSRVGRSDYAQVEGWEAPTGRVIIGRVDPSRTPLETSAYGSQHGLLHPLLPVTSGQPGNELETSFTVEPGERYALVFSVASLRSGNQLRLRLEGTDAEPRSLPVPEGAWREEVVLFTATGPRVRLQAFAPTPTVDHGALAYNRGEVDVLFDIAGVFHVCEAPSESAPEAP